MHSPTKPNPIVPHLPNFMRGRSKEPLFPLPISHAWTATSPGALNQILRWGACKWGVDEDVSAPRRSQSLIGIKMVLAIVRAICRCVRLASVSRAPGTDRHVCRAMEYCR